MERLNLEESKDIFDRMIYFEPNYENERQFISKKTKYFFIFIQMVLCLDFGFIEYKSKRIKLWVKLWLVVCSLFQGISVLTILYVFIDNSEYQMWGIKFMAEYYSYIWIIMLTPESRSYCLYQMKLQCFDKNIQVESSSYKINVKILLYWSLSALYDLITLFLYYYFSEDYVLLSFLQILYYIPSRTNNFPLIVLLFVFYSAYCRLEKLKIFIKKRRSSVKRAHQLYRFLIDSLEDVLRSFKYILIVHMILNIPTVIGSLYTLLKAIRDNDEVTFTLVGPYIDLLPIIIVEVVPTIASSWLSQEVMDIKTILHNQVLEERHESNIQAMEKFISYIETRPFKFYMLTMIPMDASLPIILLNLCVTYLIVCLQLSHTY